MTMTSSPSGISPRSAVMKSFAGRPRHVWSASLNNLPVKAIIKNQSGLTALPQSISEMTKPSTSAGALMPLRKWLGVQMLVRLRDSFIFQVS